MNTNKPFVSSSSIGVLFVRRSRLQTLGHLSSTQSNNE
jgi:hypothetical protein